MRAKLFSFVAALGLAGASASAALVASDNAGNYNSGNWGLAAPNNGTGFGAWASFATNNDGPPYAGTYYDNSGKNIGTSGNSWGVYANSPTTVNPRTDLVRPFLPAPGGYADPSGLGTLYNQAFSAAYQTDGIGNAGQGGGLSLDSGQGAGATANPVITIGYLGGGTDNMTLIDNNGTDNTTVPLTFNNVTNGIIISVAVGANPDGLNPYSITISPAPGNTTFTTPVVLTGSENGAIQQADLFNNNATNNQYFNSLAITPEAAVPEPATLGLLGSASLLLTFRRRRLAHRK